MRIGLVARAERSIDIQVHEFFIDVTGNAWLYRLLEAADRGVRVRLLLDDIKTSGYDAGMAGVDSHPNFEIRVFNPFNRGVFGRTGGALANFGRVNRRMHNKTFVVDNKVAIIGGRNMGDEYYNASGDARFRDLDAFCVGPVVAEASAMFDEYWNHEVTLPLAAFAKMPDNPAEELERVRRESAAAHAAAMETRYAAAVEDQKVEFADLDANRLTWVPYTLIYDSPDKGIQARKDEAELLKTPLLDALNAAQFELIVVTPFFVPRKSGIEWFSELETRGVQVTVVTNSLASQSQILVHGGYAPARKPLLRAGVRLHELRPDEVESGTASVDQNDRVVRLHTKAFVIDRKVMFVGSFNVDPRSLYLNTESGLILRSEELAQEFAEAVEAALPRRTYEVYLNENGKLRWRYEQDGQEVVSDTEPHTTWGLRSKARFYRLLPIRSHL
jgi:putative cardiolipin synthase